MGKLRRIRKSLAAYDTKIYKFKSWIALLVSALVLTLGLMVGFTVLGGSWPASWHLAPVTLSDEVQAMLAVGTLALATAALVQAVSAERSRFTALWPHFTVTLENGGKAVFDDATTFCPVTSPEMWFEVSNVGPGHAIGARVYVYIWSVESGKSFPGPLKGAVDDRAPDRRVMAVDSWTIGPRDPGFRVELKKALSDPQLQMANAGPGSRVAVQFVVQVQGSTVTSDGGAARGLGGACLIGQRPEVNPVEGEWRSLKSDELAAVVSLLTFDPPKTWPEHAS